MNNAIDIQAKLDQNPTGTMMPEDMTIEQLVEERERLCYLADEIKAAVEVFNAEILIRLSKEKLTGTVVGDKTISKVIRFIWSTVTLDKAKELGATKLTVDTAILKKLYKKDPSIFPEVEKREGLMIRTIAHKEDNP